MVKISKKDVERNLRLPKKYSKELAEFFGILTGDGYIGLYRKYDYVMDISGNKLLDLEYLENHVSNLIKNLFNLKSCIIKRKDQNTVYIRIRSKGLFFYLKENGFKIGIKGRIGIPRWIMKNEEFLIYFIRGLFDTDGTICLKNRNGKIYPVVSICSKSDLLLKKVKKFIDSKNIPLYFGKEVILDKRYKKPIVMFRIQINGYKNTKKWIELISTKNQRILSKIEKIKKEWEERDLNPRHRGLQPRALPG